MPDATDRAQAITDTVHRYLEAVGNGGADDLDTVLLVLLPANVVATQADDAHFLAGAPERAVTHLSPDRLLWPPRWLFHGDLSFRF